MAKNRKNPPRDTEKEKDYYKLNTEAVDRLVNANNMEVPKKGRKYKDPAKQYRTGILDRIPATVKALFVKWWFNASLYFFIIMGLPMNEQDRMFIFAAVLGMVTDILVNNALRLVETIPDENNKWMMFPQKKYWTFIANIFYAFLVLFCVIWLYEVLKIGVEPILFGIFYMLFDLLFVGIKNLIKTALCLYDKKVFARECIVKELNKSEAKNFLEEYHLQGNRPAKINLGLFYKDELVQIITFDNTKYNKNLNSKNDWEIIRECSKAGYIIVGGKAKLFKYFIKQYKPTKVFSYCDFNKFTGNSYLKLGMLFTGYSGPDMKWLMPNGQVQNRNPKKNQELKEQAQAKIFGCGSLKYVYERADQLTALFFFF